MYIVSEGNEIHVLMHNALSHEIFIIVFRTIGRGLIFMVPFCDECSHHHGIGKIKVAWLENQVHASDSMPFPPCL